VYKRVRGMEHLNQSYFFRRRERWSSGGQPVSRGCQLDKKVRTSRSRLRTCFIHVFRWSTIWNNFPQHVISFYTVFWVDFTSTCPFHPPLKFRLSKRKIQPILFKSTRALYTQAPGPPFAGPSASTSCQLLIQIPMAFDINMDVLEINTIEDMENMFMFHIWYPLSCNGAGSPKKEVCHHSFSCPTS
jgi:hypothetical protein